MAFAGITVTYLIAVTAHRRQSLQWSSPFNNVDIGDFPLFTSTASARSTSGEFQYGDVLDDTARSMAASIPELPPPITATRLPLNNGPSPGVGRSIRLWLCIPARRVRSFLQRAPVAGITDLPANAPLASSTSVKRNRFAYRNRLSGFRHVVFFNVFFR